MGKTMQNGYYSTVGAMVTQFNRLDVISNNLANVNTTAFKRDDVVIGDFKRIFQEYQEKLPLPNHTKEASKFVNAAITRVPQVVEQYINYHQGGIKNTGNPLDFALQREDVFFMVETPNGIRLTQNGSFMINQEGFLATKEGYLLLPSTYFTDKQYINVPQEERLSADKMGALYAGADELARLLIVQSDDVKRLTKEENGLYRFETLSELRELADANVVAQGFLETSNINPVTEMVNLIETNRLVEMYQKVMHAHMNDLNTDAITKLASIKA